jgi:Ca2+-binding RTX toxin-like protein
LATINGTSGNDSLAGTSGFDSIRGLEGDDTIDGGGGFDSISGGPGDDTLVLARGYGEMRASSDEAGVDTLRIKTSRDEVSKLLDYVINTFVWDANGIGSTVPYQRYREIVIPGATWKEEAPPPAGYLEQVRFDDTGVLRIAVLGARSPEQSELITVPVTNWTPEAIDGGGGDDFLFGTARDTLIGGEGNDYVSAGTNDFDADWFDGGTGIDTISYAATDRAVMVDLGGSVATGAGEDQVFNFEAVVGSRGNDTLVGRDGAGDTIRGHLGNDTMRGGSLDDVLDGGGGDDWVEGGDDDDTLDGGAGNDTLHSGFGFNLLRGGDGNDQLSSSGDDVLYGGAGNDYLSNGWGGTTTMHGGAGDDTLGGAGGRNVVNGGTGNDTIAMMGNKDTFLFGPGSGHDIVHNLHGLPSRDVIVLHATRFTSFDELMAATLQVGEDTLITIDENTSVRLTRFAKSQLQPGDFVFVTTALTLDPDDAPRPPPVAIELTGTNGNDTLLGTAGRDTISGLAGNDLIDGGIGSDIINGDEGDDTVVVGLGYGAVSLGFGGGGLDTVRLAVPLEDVAWVRDTFVNYAPSLPDWDYFRSLRLTDDTTVSENRRFGGGTLDVLHTVDHGAVYFDLVDRAGNDILPGDDGDDRLEAGGGNDVLYGNGGSDVMLGSAGDDYVATGLDDAKADWLDGGDGIDTVSYSGATNGGVTIDIGRSYAWGAGIGHDQVFNFEAAIGSAGNDVLIGRDGAGDTLKGYWGNDWLYAGSADDILYGGQGSDVLLGEGDDDTLDGGEGADWLYGGSGSNSIVGGGGVDVLISQGSGDTLVGGAGGDYLYAYGSGVTQAAGGAGNDIFVMQQGAGYASGGDEQDYFYMGAGSDTMIGGAGVDVLLGGGGNDYFDGGAGTDYLFLRAGSSVVMFRADSGADVVNGFKAEGARHVIRFEGTPFRSANDVQAATYDFNGDALIRIDSETVVWLAGVSKSQLSASDFAIA